MKEPFSNSVMIRNDVHGLQIRFEGLCRTLELCLLDLPKASVNTQQYKKLHCLYNQCLGFRGYPRTWTRLEIEDVREILLPILTVNSVLRQGNLNCELHTRLVNRLEEVVELSCLLAEPFYELIKN